MLKRIILISTTLLGILLCLLILQQITRRHKPPLMPDDSIAKRPDGLPEETLDAISPDGGIGVGAMRGVEYSRRNQEGRLLAQVGFEERLRQQAGRFEVRNPWAKFYAEDGRQVDIRAPRGWLPVSFIRGELEWPERGALEDGVVIKVFGKPANEEESKADAANRPVEVAIALERVEFERDMSRIRSQGKVRIDSEQFIAVGKDLSLQYDQINRRLQELELRRIERLRFVNVSLPDAGGNGAPGMSAGADDIKGEKSSTKNPNDSAVTYLLSLQDDVQLSHGQDRISADTVTVRVVSPVISNSDLAPPAPGDKQGSDAATGKPDQRDMVDITCKGPMRINALDTESDPCFSELFFTLHGQPQGRPVEIWRKDIPVAQAARIQYAHHIQTLSLFAANEQDIWLSPGQGHYLTSEQSIEYEQVQGLVTLRGPGEIHYVIDDENGFVSLSYRDTISVKLQPEESLRPEVSAMSSQAVEWVAFDGGVVLNAELGRLQANQGRLDFAVPDPCAAADGEAQLRSARLSGKVRADKKKNHFEANAVTVQFGSGGAKSALPLTMRAEGDIVLESDDWRIDAKDYVYLGFDNEPENRTQRLQWVETLNRQSYGVEDDEDDESREGGGFARFFEQDMDYIELGGESQGVTLKHKKGKLEIVSDRVEGNILEGLWQIYGTPMAEVSLDRTTDLWGGLQTPHIMLDMDAGRCIIPRNGRMTIMSAFDLEGRKLQEPMPLNVNWEDRAEFGLYERDVVFYETRSELRRTTQTVDVVNAIECPVLSLILKEETSGELVSGNVTSLHARGPAVRLSSRQLHARTLQPELVSEVRVEDLRYDGSRNKLIAKGAGWIDIVDYRRAESQPETSKDDRAFSRLLSDTMGRQDGPTRTLLSFNKGMTIDNQKNIVLFEEEVSFYRSPAEEVSRREDLFWLMRFYCDNLELSGRTSGPAENDGGLTTDTSVLNDLSALKAWGDVAFEYASQEAERNHTATASEMHYLREENLLMFHGSSTSPVRFNGTEMLNLTLNLETGEFESKGVLPGYLSQP